MGRAPLGRRIDRGIPAIFGRSNSNRYSSDRRAAGLKKARERGMDMESLDRAEELSREIERDSRRYPKEL